MIWLFHIQIKASISVFLKKIQKVQYHHIDEVIDVGLAIGPDLWACRIDALFAFRNHPMAYSELKYLAFTLNGKIYINSSLPFGTASSCAIFEKVACALQWIVSNETGCYWLSHFLDDCPLLQENKPKLQNFMEEFYQIFEEIGMPIAKHKTLGPTQILEYLGLILNFVLQTIQIPDKKREKCVSLINHLLNAKNKKVTVKIIQQTAGSLNFYLSSNAGW